MSSDWLPAPSKSGQLLEILASCQKSSLGTRACRKTQRTLRNKWTLYRGKVEVIVLLIALDDVAVRDLRAIEIKPVDDECSWGPEGGSQEQDRSTSIVAYRRPVWV